MIGHIVCGHTIRHVTGQSMPSKSLQNIAQAQILASSSIQTVVVVTSFRGKKIHYALCSIKAATNQQHNIKVHSYTGTIIVIKNFFKTFCAKTSSVIIYVPNKTRIENAQKIELVTF